MFVVDTDLHLHYYFIFIIILLIPSFDYIAANASSFVDSYLNQKFVMSPHIQCTFSTSYDIESTTDSDSDEELSRR